MWYVFDKRLAAITILDKFNSCSIEHASIDVSPIDCDLKTCTCTPHCLVSRLLRLLLARRSQVRAKKIREISFNTNIYYV